MRKILEDSPNTVNGSFTKDLLFSKFWLCDEIKSCMAVSSIDAFNNTVVLGAWFGNMSMILPICGIASRSLHLVDIDPRCTGISKILASRFPGNCTVHTADARSINYGTSTPLLVINTSCNDMEDGWYQRIPPGAMVALQSRNDHEPIDGFKERFPLSKTLYCGSRSLLDPEEPYERFSLIGIK